MKLELLLLVYFSINTLCVELDEEGALETTVEPYAVADFSELLHTLKGLDTQVTTVLGSLTPVKDEGKTLVRNLQGYVMNLGPLVHWMAAEDTDVMMVAKSVYHQGAPKFLLTPVNDEVVRQAFEWDEDQMTLIHTLYDMASKTWRNFLNMCERHRIEG